MKEFSLLITGSIVFTLGQFIRAVRWQYLIPDPYRPTKRNLLWFITIGSVINLIIPLKFGDLIRIFMCRRFGKCPTPYSISSVLLERLSDAIAFLFIFFLISEFEIESLPAFLVYSILFSLISFILPFSKGARKIFYQFSTLWNERIKLNLLESAWVNYIYFKLKLFVKPKYLLLSTLMWFLYIYSYHLFSNYLNLPLSPKVLERFISTNIFTAFSNDQFKTSFYIFVLTSTSVLLLLVYFVFQKVLSLIGINRNQIDAFSSSFSVESDFRNTRTLNFDVRKYFLESFFKKDDILASYLKDAKISDFNITRLFQGASGAITALIESSKEAYVIKIADKNNSQRLREQYEYLSSKEKDNFIINAKNWHKGLGYSSYLMNYDSKYCDCFQWVHENQPEKVIKLINKVIEYIEKLHIKKKFDEENQNYLLEKYHEEKVLRNIEFALKSASSLINLNKFSLNGFDYSIKDLYFLKDINKIKRIISLRDQHQIHGDLTLDNILVRNEKDFKLIDPNPHKGFSNELIDWAKIMQSTHSGYEFIFAPNYLSIENSNILCIAPTSNTYKIIHNHLERYIFNKFGNEGLNQVYLHEIIHFLRLLPYKFASSTDLGLYFLAHTCKLTLDFQKRISLD